MDALESNLWMLNEDFIHFRGYSNFRLKDLQADGVPIIREDLTDEEKKTLTEYNKDMQQARHPAIPRGTQMYHY